MAKDIEEFLKMAAARRRAAQAGGGAQGKQPPPSSKPPRAQSPPKSKATKSATRIDDSKIKVVEAKSESVAEHVKSHIDTSQLVSHAQSLGAEVGLADDKLNERLQSTFDHDVGTLGGVGPESRSKSHDKKSSLLASLTTARSIRQAIILTEILKRPDWS